MAGPWLYCIAASAKRSFVVGRRTLPVTFDTFAHLIENGEISKDPWWYVTRNWKNVERGDDLFVYTGDKDRGIIGYATIRESADRGDSWYLRLDFDLPKCRALLRDPIPAPVVRGWIPVPRGNVLSLEAYATEIYARVPWRRKRRRRGNG